MNLSNFSIWWKYYMKKVPSHSYKNRATLGYLAQWTDNQRHCETVCWVSRYNIRLLKTQQDSAILSKTQQDSARLNKTHQDSARLCNLRKYEKCLWGVKLTVDLGYVFPPFLLTLGWTQLWQIINISCRFVTMFLVSCHKSNVRRFSVYVRKSGGFWRTASKQKLLNIMAIFLKSDIFVKKCQLSN